MKANTYSSISAVVFPLIFFGCDSSTNAAKNNEINVRDTLIHTAWDSLPNSKASPKITKTSDTEGDISLWFAASCQPSALNCSSSMSKDTLTISLENKGTTCSDWTPTAFAKIHLQGDISQIKYIKYNSVKFARIPSSEEDDLGILDLTKMQTTNAW